MTGLAEDLSFMCFSKEVGVEKPDARIFEAARKAAEPWLEAHNSSKEPLLPSEVLHIGNDYEKDYVGAREAGFHAVLLDRFQDEAANEWRQNGAPVFSDLIDVVMYAARDGLRKPLSWSVKQQSW
jgi:FMN phosphatase YigB (HAD superfamily)